MAVVIENSSSRDEIMTQVKELYFSNATLHLNSEYE